ncbi:PilZ domain-containing protein [Sphingomonas piscis]|uniref:PilZ domain-containing protein n=1 Tax=Sphingomonas piscis TaxID=2714943 RepID=UPI003CCCF1C4
MMNKSFRPERQPRRFRQAPRNPVNLSGFAVHPWGEFDDLTVVNMSYEGCEIRSPVKFIPGDTFELRVARRGIISAPVRWTGLQRAGCQFVLDADEAAACVSGNCKTSS